MARKLSDVLVEARYYLQDTYEPYRQSDAELEMYLQDAFGHMYLLRPDIFPATDPPCGDPIPTWASLDEDFPLSGQWFRAAALHVAGAAELKDDEHVSNGKAAEFFARSEHSLGIGMGAEQ